MNRFPNRGRRKGKRPPKSDNAGVEPQVARDESNASADSKRGSENWREAQNVSSGGSNDAIRNKGKRSRNRDRAGNVNRTPQPSAYLDADENASKAKRYHKSKERNSQGRRSKFDKARGNSAVPWSDGALSSTNRSKSHQSVGKENKQANQGDHFLRNLRAPVKPVPSVSYDPEKSKRKTTTGPKNAYGGQHRQLYAALDLGTNNCRLLVALPQERGRFRVIDGFSRIVRLGEGLGHSGSLKQEAMDRAVEALKICAEKLAGHNVKRHRLIATEACRQADNGEAFLERVKQETGLDLEIINRQTEASLAAEGCGSLMDRKADAGVLFDIGGGSSELMLVNRRTGSKRITDQIVSWHSLPVGVVTLSERFGGEKVNRETFKAMVQDVLSLLDRFEGRDQLSKIWKNGRVHLLGTSGTVTTLAGIHLELPRYDRSKVDGLWLSDNQIDNVLDSLLSMDYEQRAASPCVGKERADLVMAGCAILEAIRITWPCKRLRVADRGLREGILTQLMDKDGAWIKNRKNAGQENAKMVVSKEAAMSNKNSGSGKSNVGRSGRKSVKSRSLHTKVKTARGRKLSSTLWLQRQLNDPYVKQAKAEGYASRAAFKLKEIDERFNILKSGMRVIDLGAAPGGWCQVSVEQVGSLPTDIHVVGIDYLEMAPVPGATILQMDFLDDEAPDELMKALDGHAPDVVMSDMAAPTTGHRKTDHLRTMHLVEVALDFALKVLKPGGSFLSKTFQGGTEADLLALLKSNFEQIQHVKPPASRDGSVELYLLARGFKG